MQLYTSLVRLKQSMNGGVIPMTPITANAKRFIDPDFTIGMGALMEDEKKGLRCPVKECGVYRHFLTAHLNGKHGGIGGANAVRAALDIPPTVSLLSQRLRDRRAAATRKMHRDGVLQSRSDTSRMLLSPLQGRKYGFSAASRNLASICDAQVGHRLLDLQNELGHSPSAHQFALAYGEGLLSTILHIYGTWNAFKARMGLNITHKHGSPEHLAAVRDTVLEAIEAWYKTHGALPTASQTKYPPILFSYTTVLYAMGAKSWSEAMSAAAWHLGIDEKKERTA